MSGNTMRGDSWSDGRNIYPMLPRLSIIQKCPDCGKYSLIEQWENTGRTDCKQCGTTGTLSYTEAKEAYIQLRQSALMTKFTYKIALYFVHAYNDEFKRPKLRDSIHEKGLRLIVERYYPSPSDDDINLFYEATQYVIDYSESALDAQILKAELHRERGEWMEAYEILHKITAGKKQWMVDAILHYTCNRNSSLLPFVIGGRNIDYSNQGDRHTLSIPEKHEVLIERQNNIEGYLKSIPTKRERDIFTDSLGGIYDKTTNTLLKLISPSIKRYDIKEGINHIGDYAVYRNEQINKIQFSPDLKTIGVKAFYGCKNLSVILALHPNIHVIEDRAFMNCKSLTHVQFMDNVRYLGRSVFAGMDKLQSIVLPQNIDSIPEFTFFECKSLEYIGIPSSIRNIESYSFQHTAITEFDMPDSVETLGDAVFSRCFSLKSVKLSSKLTSIPERTFDSCKALRYIELPKRIKVIKKGAFEDTSSLKCIRFQGKVKIISRSAFKNSGLEIIIVPFGTKSHYQRLFPNAKIEIKLF